jgi:hypothetical protein
VRLLPPTSCFCSDASPTTARENIAFARVPSGWLSLKDAETKRKYYHNTVTGITTWVLPTESALTTTVSELPEGWRQLRDPVTSNIFFQNLKNDQVTWAYPLEAATKELEIDYTVPMYQGALSKPIKILKKVSVTTCFLTLTVMPALLLTGNPNVPLAGKMAISLVVAAAGVGTTLMLNFFVRSYVHQMYESRDGVFTAYGLNLFGMHKESTFRTEDIKPLPDSFNPFITFEANGNGYFIQGGFFKDKKLLRKMVGQPLAEDERDYEELDLR